MKILFIGNTRLGDAILSTCILQKFNKAGNEITVVCGPLPSEIYSGYTYVCNTISIKKKKYSKHWLEVYKKLKTIRWDVIIDLRNTLISRLLNKKIIYRLEKNKDGLHRVEQLTQLIKIKKIFAPKIFVPQKYKNEASLIINKLSIDKNTLAISPATNWHRKNWPIEHFILLVESLLNEKKININKVIILGSITEFNYCEKLRLSLKRKKVINLSGQLSILSIHEVLRKCILFVGNDSGLTHLAAASGVNTLALFGPSKDKNYRPWGKNGFFLRTPQSFEELVNRKGYNRFDSSSLMTSLSVETVFEKCLAILKKKIIAPII